MEDEYNAVHVANTPCYDALRKVPGRFRSILAHGTAVGLPSDADMGNSEVGHNALGAGQVIDQGASLVDKALASGSIYEGTVLLSFLRGNLGGGGLVCPGEGGPRWGGPTATPSRSRVDILILPLVLCHDTSPTPQPRWTLPLVPPMPIP